MGILLKWMIWGIFLEKKSSQEDEVVKKPVGKERFIEQCPIV